MKKTLTLFAVAIFMTSASVCCATDQKLAAPAAPAAPAPAPVPAKPAPAPKANEPGKEVPAWEATAFDSTTVYSSEKLKGQPYAIVFVNSACASCREEVGQLNNLKFGDFTVMLAATDAKMDRISETYREKMNVTYPIVTDSKFLLARKFGISFTPATVIVDKSGKVEAWFVGYTDENQDDIAKAYKKYLK